MQYYCKKKTKKKQVVARGEGSPRLEHKERALEPFWHRNDDY